MKTLRDKNPLKMTQPCCLSSSRGKDQQCSSRLHLFRPDYFIMIAGDDCYAPKRSTDFLRLLGAYVVAIGSPIKGKLGKCHDTNQRIWQSGACRRGSDAL